MRFTFVWSGGNQKLAAAESGGGKIFRSFFLRENTGQSFVKLQQMAVEKGSGRRRGEKLS